MIVAYALLAGKLARLDGPSTNSLVQGALRHNGFLVLSIVQVAFGMAALEIVAIAIAFLVPISNIVSIVALSFKPRGHGGGLRRAAAQEPCATFIGCHSGRGACKSAGHSGAPL